MKMTVFWDTVPCSLVEVHRRFRGAYSLHNNRVKALHYRKLLCSYECTSYRNMHLEANGKMN
jgi:hypothetical protein